jgi:hypothetical protein
LRRDRRQAQNLALLLDVGRFQDRGLRTHSATSGPSSPS